MVGTMRMIIRVMRRIEVVMVIVLFINARCSPSSDSNRVGAIMVKKRRCVRSKAEEVEDDEDNYNSKRN